MNNVKVDILQKKITITKSFYRASQVPWSYEYETLLRIQRELPDYEIQLAEPPRRNNKKLFPSYADMERAIVLLGGEVKELHDVIEMSRMYSNPYNFVRQWFFKNNPLNNGEDFAA